MAFDYRPRRLSLPKTIPARGDGVAHRGWEWRRPHRTGVLNWAVLRAVLAERPGIRLPPSVAGAASSRGSWDHPGLHRQQALALHFLRASLRCVPKTCSVLNR
jgi:hypothetical protein